MKILLDTHALIWFSENDKQLSKKAKESIEDSGTDIFISTASLWEMAIKLSLNKLKLNKNLSEIIARLNANDINILSISPAHILLLEKLKFHHKDPFDRLLIAQGLTKNVPIITKDPNFIKYKVKIIWQ